jgi:hypothetical protein
MKISLLLAAVILSLLGRAQSAETIRVNPFEKIVISPRIHVVLTQGEKESVSLQCNGVSSKKVNVISRGDRLLIYLDHARYVEKKMRVVENSYTRKANRYEDVSVTAYITYRDLNSIEIRGEQDLICDNKLTTNKLKLIAYGKTEMYLDTLAVDKLKVKLYGENRLRINNGTVAHQVYRLYGKNRIDNQGLVSETTKTSIYGEGVLRIFANEEVHINAFGEPLVKVDGQARVYKGLLIGKAEIQ